MTKNIGPLALLRDLAQTARILSRFGPRLPAMVEAALIAQAKAPNPLPKGGRRRILQGGIAATLVLAIGVWIGHSI